MSFENSNCPCGGKKPNDTMLCDDCVSAFSNRRELAEYQDGKLPLEWRRNAAIILVTLARSRRRKSVASSFSNFNSQPMATVAVTQ
jgi:hypothetical protein